MRLSGEPGPVSGVTVSGVTVRRVVAADWSELRRLRLAALADTPIAYLETLAEAELLPDSAWQVRVARGAEGGDSLQVLALDGDRAVGTSVSFTSDGRAWLAAVYLDPAWRGRGLLGRLLQPCAAWAWAHGFDQLALEVHEDNPRAQAAYARLGFGVTGVRRPYPLDPTREEREMVLVLPSTLPAGAGDDSVRS